MLHIFNDKNLDVEEENMEDPSQKPSLLSYFGAIVGVASLIMSLAYIVFVAGGQATTIIRHEDEIKRLQESRESLRENMVTKEDFRRLESKVDQIVDREIRSR